MINDAGDKAYFNEIKNMEKKFTKASTELLSLLESVDDHILPDLKACLDRVSSKKSKDIDESVKNNSKDSSNSQESSIMDIDPQINNKNSNNHNNNGSSDNKTNENNLNIKNISINNSYNDNNNNNTKKNNNGNNNNNNVQNININHQGQGSNIPNSESSNLDLLTSAINMIQNTSFINNNSHNANNSSTTATSTEIIIS